MPYIYGTNPTMTDTITHGTDTPVYGYINVDSIDANGYVQHMKPLKCNLAATAAPGVGNDNTQGYAIGSEWWDTTNHHFYKASSVATGAANWVTLG